MNNVTKIERRDAKKREIRDMVSIAMQTCNSFFHNNYRYDDSEAIEELGLDEELIHQLLEDYVVQIIKSSITFEKLIDSLKSKKERQESLNYTELRDLAHKNLGVARNLRIKDSETLLTILMKEDNLVDLLKCVKVLRSSAIKLKPECAFNTIKLIEVKSSFN